MKLSRKRNVSRPIKDVQLVMVLLTAKNKSMALFNSHAYRHITNALSLDKLRINQWFLLVPRLLHSSIRTLCKSFDLQAQENIIK